MKKVLAFVLAVMLVAALLPTMAFAAAGPAVAITADKTEVEPGDTITFTVKATAADDFGTLGFKLSIPSGLTFVSGSGTLKTAKTDVGADECSFTEGSLQYILVRADMVGIPSGTYTLMTFQCKVDTGASGSLSVGTTALESLDAYLENTTASATGATVTVKGAEPECEHKNTEIKNAKEATCAEKGYTGDTYCKDCNQLVEKGKETEKLTTHGETELKNVKEATCKEEGYTGDKVCKICGETVEAGKKTEKLTTHGETELKNVKEATCKDEGYTGDKVCKICGEIVEAGKKLDKLTTHGETELKNVKEATCKEKGYTGDKYCKICGEKIEDGKETELAAHTPGDPTKENEVKATCKEGGSYEEVIKCKVCGEEISRTKKTTEKTNEHDFSGVEWIVTKEATEDEEGSKQRTCKVCGYIETQRIPPKKTPSTGDSALAVICAIALAVSAAGIVVLSKKRHHA